MYIVLGGVMMFLGVFCFVAPDTVWYLEAGWRYKDVRPSDLAIGINRIVGVVGGLVGLGMMIYGLIGCFGELMPGNGLTRYIKVENIESIKIVARSGKSVVLEEDEVEEVVSIIKGGAVEEFNNIYAGSASRNIQEIIIKFNNEEVMSFSSFVGEFFIRFDGKTYILKSQELENIATTYISEK